MYIDVFNLYGVKYKYDPNLSVTKMFAYYENDSLFSDAVNYVQSMKDAHQQLI